VTKERTNDDYVIEFIKAFKAVEEEMEPYKEHRRDLKKNYVENGYLTKDELRFAVKAYRMIKSDDDFDHLTAIYKNISGKIGI